MTAQLPTNPNLQQLRNQAKELLKAHKAGDPFCCDTLRQLHQFKGRPDNEILKANVGLQEVQFALAMEYGFESWTQLKTFLDLSAKARKGVSLNWKDIVGDKPNCRIDNGDLVVENPKGEGAALHIEFGGMSWDNYQLGVDVLVEKNSSPDMELAANVQLCPRGTSVFCQIFGVGRSWGNCINLWHWDRDVKKEIHVAHVARAVDLNTWYRFEVAVESPRVSIFFDGDQVIDERLVVGTDGMPGLVVNYASDARVKLRNLRIRFLKPTRLQVEEYGTEADTNWTNYKRREIEAGRRKSMDNNSL